MADDRLAEAAIVAEQADVVIACVGLDETLEGEEGDTGNFSASGDKVTLSLPESQQRLMAALAATGRPLVTVLTVGSALNSLILGRLGYDQNAVPGGQSEKVEYTIFALFSVIPSTLSLIGMIPKFFYDLSGEKRDRMYAELHDRRALAMHAEHNLGDEEN